MNWIKGIEMASVVMGGGLALVGYMYLCATKLSLPMFYVALWGPLFVGMVFLFGLN